MTDPGAALKLDVAVPVTRCRRSNVVPCSVGSNGAPDHTMIVTYRDASHGVWSDKLRQFLGRQLEADSKGFQASCTANEAILSHPPESWRSSGFFVKVSRKWLPPSVRVRPSVPPSFFGVDG